MFQAEIWRIVADTEWRIYCNAIDNRLVVTPERGGKYPVFIRVPSDLFFFLQNVGGISPQDLLEKPVSLYLDQYEGEWYFGLSAKDGEEEIDLWKYNKLPGWARK